MPAGYEIIVKYKLLLNYVIQIRNLKVCDLFQSKENFPVNYLKKIS